MMFTGITFTSILTRQYVVPLFPTQERKGTQTLFYLYFLPAMSVSDPFKATEQIVRRIKKVSTLSHSVNNIINIKNHSTEFLFSYHQQ